MTTIVGQVGEDGGVEEVHEQQNANSMRVETTDSGVGVNVTVDDASPNSSRRSSPGGATNPSKASTTDSETQSDGLDGEYPHERDPFFAFVPQVAKWACGIVGNEASIAAKGVVGCPKFSVNFLKDTIQFYRENPKILFKEIISGFTVAIMQVPESIAFSFVAGVPPLSGLHATFWMATITGIFGGKPGMISGAAGALAVVVADLTADNGPLHYLTPAVRLNVLYMTMFVCGLAQILFAWLRLAKLVKMIPETGMIGFMNGLAIIIFMAQLPAFQYCTEQPLFIECTLEQRRWLTFQEQPFELTLVLVHVAMCMAIMKTFPLIPVLGRIVPASLMGLIVGTVFEWTLFRQVFNVATRTVKETAPMSGSAPQFDWPTVPTDTTTMNTIVVFGVTLAAIGGVESVLTLQACNEITDTVPKISDSNQELFAQGLANLMSGLFRAMGGDAMIGQSTINIMNGARYRVSSTMSGIFMLLFVVALSPLIELLPVATLTGVLFMVVLSTFQWKTFMILRYGRLSDSAAIILVTLIAIFMNLAVAIAVGIIFSALVHVWDAGAHVECDVTHKPMLVNGEEVPDCKYVHVRGAIFFSSSRKFINSFSVADDPDTVIIDLKDALVIDHSAVAAIQGIAHRFRQAGKRVILVNVGHKSNRRLHRTGNHEALKEEILSHGSTVEDVENQRRQSSGQGAAGGATTEGQPHHPHPHAGDQQVDEYRVGQVLEDLPMFQDPSEPIQAQLDEVIEKEELEFSVHSLKKQK